MKNANGCQGWPSNSLKKYTISAIRFLGIELFAGANGVRMQLWHFAFDRISWRVNRQWTFRSAILRIDLCNVCFRSKSTGQFINSLPDGNGRNYHQTSWYDIPQHRVWRYFSTLSAGKRMMNLGRGTPSVARKKLPNDYMARLWKTPMVIDTGISKHCLD